jgi:hypothetical protein
VPGAYVAKKHWHHFRRNIADLIHQRYQCATRTNRALRVLYIDSSRGRSGSIEYRSIEQNDRLLPLPLSVGCLDPYRSYFAQRWQSLECLAFTFVDWRQPVVGWMGFGINAMRHLRWRTHKKYGGPTYQSGVYIYLTRRIPQQLLDAVIPIKVIFLFYW